MSSDTTEFAPSDKSSSDDLDKLVAIAFGDMNAANEDLRQGDTPYRRRALVRASVIYIEAVTVLLRQTVCRTFANDHCQKSYSEEERKLLEDQKALGRIHRDVADRFRFCLEMSAKPFHKATLIQPGVEPGWKSFKTLIQVRR